jgi:tetratricopeptide (TPR) repeat protein
MQTSGLRRFVQRNWLWGLLAVILIGTMSAAGGYGGLLSGQAERRALAEAAAVMDLADQVNLGMADLQAGRYDVARQRFEFVLNQDPNFPGAADGLVQALQVLNATATPTPPPATPTLTPTRDLRPVEELLAQALAQMKNSDWAGVIDTLNALRKEDPDYQVTRVDGYLYIALRYRGVDKILNQSNLEGGIYDLSLAEQFGPLDSDALGSRNLARLYIIGSSFWEAIPEQAVYYFSQVAAAAPYLRDASGWTARERYRLSLVQYGDQLAASENWCDAQIQYEAALSMQADSAIGQKAEDAALRCAPPTETPTLTETATLTLTPSPTLPVVVTPEPTTPGATTPVATTPVATTPAGTTEVPTTTPTTPVPTTADPSTPTPTPTTPAPTTEVPPPDDPTPTETTPAPPAVSTAEPFENPSTVVPPAAPPSATTAAPLGLLVENLSAPVGLIPSSERMFDV